MKQNMNLGNVCSFGDSVPPKINSNNTTPNPVVEGGTFFFTKMGMILLFILTVSSVAALNINIYDDAGFEIDVFNAGETATISSVADEEPTITITDPNRNITEEVMITVEEGSYIYTFIPEIKGTYTIEIAAGEEFEKVQLFVTSDLDLDWEELEEENQEKNEEELQKAVEEQKKIDEEKENNSNIFRRFWNYIKEVLGILNEE